MLVKDVKDKLLKTVSENHICRFSLTLINVPFLVLSLIKQKQK